MRKIIIIRGKSCAGKTTISHALAEILQNTVFIDIWKTKEFFEPFKLKDRTITNKICKKAVFTAVKETLKHTDYNILLQETSEIQVKEKLKAYLKDVKIYSFYLDVYLEDALKRNITRNKNTAPKTKFIEQNKRPHFIEKNNVILNTSTLTKNKVIETMLKEIGEKKIGSKRSVRKTL